MDMKKIFLFLFIQLLFIPQVTFAKKAPKEKHMKAYLMV